MAITSNIEPILNKSVNSTFKSQISSERRNASTLVHDLWQFLKSALQHIVEHLLETLFVWLLIGLSMAIPSAFWLMYDGLTQLQSNWIEDTGFNVFLEPEISNETIDLALEEIKRHPLVDDVELTKPEAAISEFLSSSGLPVTMVDLEFESLPASIAVTVNSNVQSNELTEFIASLEAKDFVGEVSYEQTWTTRFSALKELLFRLVWFFIAVFGSSSLLVIAAAVRSAIESRLEEVKLMHLLGSPNYLIQGTFNFCGLLYGVGGALFALMILALAVQLVEVPLNTLVASYGYSTVLIGYDYNLVFSLLGMGALSGIFASFCITWQRLRHITQEINS